MSEPTTPAPAAGPDQGFAVGVHDALRTMRTQFPHAELSVEPDGVGGAHVIIDEVEVGSSYRPVRTWLGLHLSPALPHSDVYPLFVGPVERLDGAPHGEAVQPVEYRGRAALQLSRRSNGWDPTHDTAGNKAEKVIEWFREK